MGAYRIAFKKSALKDLEVLPPKDVRRILARIRELGNDPRGPGCEKLSGDDKYRVRQGSYRIIYAIHYDVLEIWVVKIGHRKDVYRH